MHQPTKSFSSSKLPGHLSNQVFNKRKGRINNNVDSMTCHVKSLIRTRCIDPPPTLFHRLAIFLSFVDNFVVPFITKRRHHIHLSRRARAPHATYCLSHIKHFVFSEAFVRCVCCGAPFKMLWIRLLISRTAVIMCLFIRV